MANHKISEYTRLIDNIDLGDLLGVIDVSEPTTPTGENKSITVSELSEYVFPRYSLTGSWFKLSFPVDTSGYLLDNTGSNIILPTDYVLTSVVVKTGCCPIISVGTSGDVPISGSCVTESWNNNRVYLMDATYPLNYLEVSNYGAVHPLQTVWVQFYSGSECPCTFSFNGFIAPSTATFPSPTPTPTPTQTPTPTETPTPTPTGTPMLYGCGIPGADSCPVPSNLDLFNYDFSTYPGPSIWLTRLSSNGKYLTYVSYETGGEKPTILEIDNIDNYIISSDIQPMVTSSDTSIVFNNGRGITITNSGSRLCTLQRNGLEFGAYWPSNSLDVPPINDGYSSSNWITYTAINSSGEALVGVDESGSGTAFLWRPETNTYETIVTGSLNFTPYPVLVSNCKNQETVIMAEDYTWSNPTSYAVYEKYSGSWRQKCRILSDSYPSFGSGGLLNKFTSLSQTGNILVGVTYLTDINHAVAGRRGCYWDIENTPFGGTASLVYLPTGSAISLPFITLEEYDATAVTFDGEMILGAQNKFISGSGPGDVVPGPDMISYWLKSEGYSQIHSLRDLFVSNSVPMWIESSDRSGSYSDTRDFESLTVDGTGARFMIPSTNASGSNHPTWYSNYSSVYIKSPFGGCA